MPDELKPVPIDKALMATRESMAVKRELTHLLSAQITDKDHTITFEADLGTFFVGTKFTFSISGVRSDTVVLFEDLKLTVKAGNAPVSVTVKLPASGENAITVVTDYDDASQWQLKMSVDASGVGRVIDHDGGGHDPANPKKRVFIWRLRAVARRKMVGWYDPPVLFRTGAEVLVSGLFGGHADYRLLEALGSVSNETYDYTGHYREDESGQYITDGHGQFVKDESRPPREEIWIDYVADIGDGWNSTYAIAYWLALKNLTLIGPDGQKEYQTERGRLLVFGGDEVYPSASRKQYKQRTVEPYRTALRYSERPHPDVFAVPGNHDWYDSLVSFTRLFCARRWFNGWRTPQQRSYFALKLPHGWWLLGIDVQLKSDLDHVQIAYFAEVAKEMAEGDRVILATAEPHWLQTKVFEKYGADYSESNLAFLENNVLGKRVSVFLSGDLHYYRHHEAADGTQKIVSGGGGAFLNPTHAEDIDELKGGFKLKASYPEESTSRRLAWRNLLFLFRNPQFGLFTGSLYFLTSWAVMADIGRFGIAQIGNAMNATLKTGIVEAGAVFWIMLILAGFVAFTTTKSKPYQWIAGLIHGCVHLFAVFLIGWGATYLTVTGFGLEFKSPLQLLIAAFLIFAGGWLAGSFLLGVFLLISLNIFHCLQVAGFTALKIEDWKNFLRLKIDRNGELTIYPVGLRRVPRKWRRRPAGASGPELVPGDDLATPPALIEPPIVVRRSS
jgi:hypothetical protein